MELLLKMPLENYEIREYPETGTMLIVRKGMKGKPDYSIEGEGMVIEFKDGQIYTIDIYDPEVAKKLREKLVLILWKNEDKNYSVTSQKINYFFKKLSKECKYKQQLILPPKEISGKELEDYIVEVIKRYSKNDKLIQEIESFVSNLEKNNLTSGKKRGKKILFSYLLLKDKCSYDGLSLNAYQFQSCIGKLLNNFKELKDILEEFIDFVKKLS